MEPITIEKTRLGYTVRQGDRYANHLAFDEMLGVVVSLTRDDFADAGHRRWMMTEAEHQAQDSQISILDNLFG